MSNYNTTLQTNNSSLEEIITQLNNMPDAGGLDTSDATATSGDILNGKNENEFLYPRRAFLCGDGGYGESDDI